MTKNEKKELQILRTQLNHYRNCIDKLTWCAYNVKSKPYDYGEAYENAIDDIKDQLKTLQRLLEDVPNKCGVV